MLREKANQLRSQGRTHREIAKEIGCSYSMAAVWTRGIILASEQKKAIEVRRKKPNYELEKEKWQMFARKNLSRFWKKPYTKKELLSRIKEFYRRHERVPLKREFNMYREYRQHFGSWNKAIEAAGFEPTPGLYVKRKFVAKDGHSCDSFSEKIIDDYLSKNKIPHTRHVLYENTKLTADFAIGDNRIEFFGLAGLQENYDKLIQRKREYCQRTGLKLIEIYPKELYQKGASQFLEKQFKTIDVEIT